MKTEDADRIIAHEEIMPESQLSAAFGRAMRLLSQASRRREQSLKLIAERLWPAVRLGHIDFLYNSQGTAIAFATWAYLTEEVSSELAGDQNRQLDISEWNEGDQFWLMDVFAPFGHTNLICRKVRRRLFAETTSVRAIRTYMNGKSSRQVYLRMARSFRS